MQGVDDLATVADAAVAAGSVRFSAVGKRIRPDRPAETELTLRGRLDLAADTGEVDLAIPALGSDQLPRLSWTKTTVTAHGETVPRRSGDTSVLARVPDEPAALLRSLARATEVEPSEAEPMDGAQHVTAALDAAAAVAAGIGLEASETVRSGPPLELDVWIGPRHLPQRVRYTATLPALGPLPVRQVAVTYDYSDWGAA